MEYDPNVGWYDPQIAYCINGDGNLAITEDWTGMTGDIPLVELLCYGCKEVS